MSDITISGSADPYSASVYKATSNDRNTLDISDYFQLLAAQLANQDMTDPMSNGEMMQQLVQMAMAESVTTMTETMETMQAVSTQTYAASLIGQEISVAVVEDGVATGVKYGKVASVNFTSADPVIRLEGDSKDYPLSYVLGMGKIDDPYKDPTETEPEDDNNVGGTDGAGSTDGVEGGTDAGETTNPDGAVDGTVSGDGSDTNTDSAGSTDSAGEGTTDSGATEGSTAGGTVTDAATEENAAGGAVTDAATGENTAADTATDAQENAAASGAAGVVTEDHTAASGSAEDTAIDGAVTETTPAGDTASDNSESESGTADGTTSEETTVE